MTDSKLLIESIEDNGKDDPTFSIKVQAFI